jgi:hypothetical protein
MEGLDIDDRYNEEKDLDTEEIKEDTEEGIEDIQKDKSIIINNPALPIILMFIVVIIGPFTYLYISGIMDEKPIYQQYTKYETHDIIVYKNEKLHVQITYDKDTLWYEAENPDMHTIGQTPGELYSNIIRYSEHLSDEQIRWFDYMCNEILK